MDTVAIEKAGLKPLRATLDSVSAIGDRRQLAQFLGSTLRADVDALNNTNFYTENLLGLWVAQDLDDPTQYSPFLLQGGLACPTAATTWIPRPPWARSARSISSTLPLCSNSPA